MADPTPADRNRGHPIASVPLGPPDQFRVTLPTPLTPLVGREREVAQVAALLSRADVRLLTLSGPGGVGKTRLSIEVAAEVADAFPDGVRFVGLAPISDAALVAPAIGQALGVREAGDTPLIERIVAFLHDRYVLLVLDNFEQVMEAAPLVADLLGACPRLTILATSRARLRISGEREHVVPPLGLARPGEADRSEAVLLFVARAQAVKEDFALTPDNTVAVAEICRRLDGLPLAIELAAARVKVLSPMALLVRLEKRLPLLTGGGRDLPARQRTMRDAIAWSYGLLTPELQALFRRLSVFAGGFTLEAAETVADAPGDNAALVDGIAELVDQSLLFPEPGPYGGSRFVMLETIREFGLECLETTREAEATRDAHAAYFVGFGERARPDFGGRFDLVEADHANLRAALTRLQETGDADGVLRLAGALAGFWQVRGHHGEGRRWLEWALARTADRPTLIRGQALQALGLVIWSQGRYDDAAGFAQASLAIADQVGDKQLAAAALTLLGLTDEIRFRWERARPHLERSLLLRRELRVRFSEAVVLFLLSGVALGMGDAALATRRAEESLAAFGEVGDPHGAANAAGYLALSALERGDDRAAALAYHDALRLWSSVGDRWWIVKALAGLAWIAATGEEPETAAMLVGGVDALLDVVGAPIFPFDRVTYLHAAASAETVLGDELFARLRATGRGCTLPDMMAIASAVNVPTGSEWHGRPPPGRVSAVLRLIEAGRTDREIIEMLKTRLTRPGRGRAPATSRDVSPREAQVLGLIAEGKTDAEIAAALFVSRRTVNAHVANVLGKLKVPNRRDAVARARDLGLLPAVPDQSRYT
ncbi:MAG: hypothetical protein QOF01_5334 [Thermomicrobiales bacterium]|nr:hypothetical protein [Thermomicrobiales bacterium]